MAVVEDIFSLYKESEQVVRLEIVGFPKGYHMRFETEHEMKSFISYLGIYIRYDFQHRTIHSDKLITFNS